MAKLSSYNLLICLVAALGGYTFGFGSATYVVSIGQPGFYAYFGLDPTSLHTASVLDAINSLFYLGAAIGAILQSYLADWVGRKKALGLTGVLAIIGNALVAGSVTVGMMYPVRILQGCALGMILTLVPLYIAEVAPPRSRGFLTAMTTFSYLFGYTTCGWISVGCYHLTNKTLSWRLPLALACIPPLMLFVGLLFIPESPRYLIWRGQREKALIVVKKLHGEEAEVEHLQISSQVEAEKEEDATFFKMFTKPSLRRRMLLAMFIMFSAQCTGILGIYNYLPVIFETLGLKKDVPLIIYATNNTLGLIAVFATMLIVDRMGRRSMFLIGFCSLAGLLLIIALLEWRYVGTNEKAGNSACVAIIILYNLVFQLIDGPAFVFVAEIFPTHLRAKGISLAVFSLFVGIITFTAPSAVAFKTIGWKMFIIYMGLSILAAIIVWWQIPETKNLPMEEIGALFGDEVVLHMTSDQRAIVEKSMEDSAVEHSEVAPVSGETKIKHRTMEVEV